jgi:hypothetical protein
MKFKVRLISAIVGFGFIQATTFGQEGKNINIRFLKAKFTDTTQYKDVIAVFLVSTADTASFPPVVNVPPKCTVFENGREKVVLLNPHNLAVSLDGEQVPQKNPDVYSLIKEVVDLNSMKGAMIITYTLKDLNYEFKRMSLTPAFREKKNNEIRVDKRCEFDVQ